jgi:hypothetical protein
MDRAQHWSAYSTAYARQAVAAPGLRKGAKIGGVVSYVGSPAVDRRSPTLQIPWRAWPGPEPVQVAGAAAAEPGRTKVVSHGCS